MSAAVTLYGPSGHPIRRSARAGWDAAGDGRRARSWRASQLSANALVAFDAETLRDRTRDQVRRNPWASNAVRRFVANHVGTGIRPQPNTEDQDLRREILDAWEDFVEECDTDATSSFYGLQALCARGMQEGGDAFLRFRPRRLSDGLSVPLQIQALEAEMCDASLNQTLGGGRKIRAGIEFDALGRRVAYHMYREHPGELVRSVSGSDRVRVPASEIVHVFHVLRAGQVRGISGLATVLAPLREIAETNDAHVLRYKIQNLFATFETAPEDATSVLDGDADAGADADGVERVTLEPGTHQVLPPGHDVKFAQPPSEGASYEAFMRVHLRAVAVGCGCTYEQLTGDLTGVNFSSIRAGLIDLWRSIEQVVEHVLIFQLCRPVWRRWFETAVLSGRIRVPAAERPRMRRFLRAKWTLTPGREYVEPEKEVKAVVRQIRAGLISRSRAVARYGFDAEELDREIAADNARADALGLIFDGDGRSDQDGGARAAAVADPAQLPEGDEDREGDVAAA